MAHNYNLVYYQVSAVATETDVYISFTFHRHFVLRSIVFQVFWCYFILIRKRHFISSHSTYLCSRIYLIRTDWLLTEQLAVFVTIIAGTKVVFNHRQNVLVVLVLIHNAYKYLSVVSQWLQFPEGDWNFISHE